MERWRDELHYFSIPGGGVEAGETPEQAVCRELLEETTIQVQVDRLVLTMRDDTSEHLIYLCEYVSGEPVLAGDAPEALHATVTNRFKPRWVAMSELSSLSLGYWEPLREELVAGLSDGFGHEVKIVTADVSR